LLSPAVLGCTKALLLVEYASLEPLRVVSKRVPVGVNAVSKTLRATSEAKLDLSSGNPSHHCRTMMAKLCTPCELIFRHVKASFVKPDMVGWSSLEFNSYQALQQNAESSTCRLCRIIFSQRRQDEIQRLIDAEHLDKLECVFEFLDEDREHLCMTVLSPEERNAVMFGSTVRFRKSQCEQVPLKKKLYFH
jgi:hypothetical protein